MEKLSTAGSFLLVSQSILMLSSAMHAKYYVEFVTGIIMLNE